MLDFIFASVTWDIAPALFTIKIASFELPITWYGLLFALGFLIGQKVISYIFKVEGKLEKDVDSLTIYAVIGTVVGARMGHYFFYEWPLMLNSPMEWLTGMIIPPFAGLASHGAGVAIFPCLYLYSRKRPDQPFLWVVDRVVIPGAIVGTMIRLGNLFNSEIYGKPTDLPWAFRFVRETDPNLLPVVPRHPTALYEALFCIFLFALTFYIWKTKRNQVGNGFSGGLFMILLFTFRFLVEFLKNRQSAFEDTMTLNMGQLLSIPAIILGIIMLVYSFKSKREQMNELAGTPEPT
jgi:phosphatidylglycerol---prolipoprotein diacylglyceryl transferase